jgi:hypothetical protein
MINCEVEAWYIWELLPQQILTSGNSAYYLSALFSAIHIIKHPEGLNRLKCSTGGPDSDILSSRTVSMVFQYLHIFRYILDTVRRQ